VAGVVAKVTEQHVEAGVDGDVVLGAFNTSATDTSISDTRASGTALSLTCTAGTNGWGLFAEGSGYGVIADSTSNTPSFGAGVLGGAYNSTPYGVWGFDGTAAGNIGVFGQSTKGTGVRGVSESGVGVYGLVPSTSNANTIAIYAENYSTYAGPGPGAGGFAIYGLCAKGHGLVGATATAGAAAVVGATNGVAGAYAAAFYGPVVVGGAFTVIGGPKSAAVPHPDGTHRRLYCMESPESWFEDFGKGELACGRADVTIDPDFAAVVDLNDYHVFLTAYDGDHGLHVLNQTPEGFTVQAKDVHANGRFSWRAVAKRKDIAAPRFETVDVPAEPVLPNIPEPSAAPEPPRLRVGARRRG
jgi:hypothetical protein